MVRMVMHVTVEWVQEKFTSEWCPTQRAMAQRSLGWYVKFHDSFESLCLGAEKPELNPGDRYKITFERIDGAAA